MGTKRKSDTNPPRRPMLTRQAREQELAGLALDAIEERVRGGVATAQELVFLAKLGLESTSLEMDQMRAQNKLYDAKVESINNATRSQEFYEKVMQEFRAYSGDMDEEDDYIDD